MCTRYSQINKMSEEILKSKNRNKISAMYAKPRRVKHVEKQGGEVK